MPQIKEPETLEELCDYIVEHSSHIFVRLKVGMSWHNRSLDELPAQEAIRHALRFVKEGRIPVRILTEEERQA